MFDDLDKLVTLTKEQIEFLYNCKVLAFYKYKYVTKDNKIIKYNVLRYIKDNKHYHITFEINDVKSMSKEELMYIPEDRHVDINYLTQKQKTK